MTDAPSSDSESGKCTSGIEQKSGDYWVSVKPDGDDVLLKLGWRFGPTITLRHSPTGAKNLAKRLNDKAREVDTGTQRDGGEN